MKSGSIAALASLALGSVFSLGSQQAMAQGTSGGNPQYVLGLAHGVEGALWTPPSGVASLPIGVVTVHRTSNYLNHASCSNLSQRGFTVFCMNTRYDDNETLVNFDLLAQDVAVAVNYLKQTAGMKYVILLGHSGGGPTTTNYQAIAVNGPSWCQGANKLSQCASSGSGSVAGLTPADGLVLLDAHPSVGVNLLRGIDPSIISTQDSDTVGLNATNPPISRNNNLFLYSPANGFNTATNGLSTYSPIFQQNYTAAESQRMNGWIGQAQHAQALIAQGNWRFPDDDSIVVAAAGGSIAGGGNEAAIFKPDNQVWCCTLQPEQVLTNNNTVVTENYSSVRLPDGSDYPGILTFDSGSKNLTITSFLSANAIRSTDALDYDQIDWCSTNDSVPCALQSIKNPILMIGMGAYYFFPDMERYYLNYSASPDRSFLIAAGLVHGLTPCPNCPGGPYTNMENNLWNYIAKWASDRFPAVAAHDFSGALKSDVLWRDHSNNIGMWLMNGATISQSKVLGAVPATWSVVGQRDFNGDGNADILWRDTSGNLGIWLMNGTNVVSSTVLGNVPTTWSVVGTGDLNANHNGDILWRDSSGNVGVWLMNGTTVSQTAVLGNVPLAWSVAGMDHKGDIFWSNSTTGEVGMWTMQGTQVTATVDFGVVPSNWQIAGIGDFDGNGSTDILWRDTSGNVGIWLMNGTSVLSTKVIGNVPLTWTIAQTGDYNGDGKADILWVDSTGNVGAWFMNGTTIASTTQYGNIGTTWTAQTSNAE